MLIDISPRAIFVLYGTLGCHLCELAEQMLAPWVSQGVVIELVDIAENDQQMERFALTIPVLEHVSSGNLLCWPFDDKVLETFIASPQEAA